MGLPVGEFSLEIETVNSNLHDGQYVAGQSNFTMKSWNEEGHRLIRVSGGIFMMR